MRGVSSRTGHTSRACLVPKCSLAHEDGRALIIFSKSPSPRGPRGGLGAHPSGHWPFFGFVPKCSLAYGGVTALIYFSIGLSTWDLEGVWGPTPRTFRQYSIFLETWSIYRFFDTNRFVSKPWWRIWGYFGIFIIFKWVGAYIWGGGGSGESSPQYGIFFKLGFIKSFLAPNDSISPPYYESEAFWSLKFIYNWVNEYNIWRAGSGGISFNLEYWVGEVRVILRFFWN